MSVVGNGIDRENQSSVVIIRGGCKECVGRILQYISVILFHIYRTNVIL